MSQPPFGKAFQELTQTCINMSMLPGQVAVNGSKCQDDSCAVVSSATITPGQGGWKPD